MKHDLKITVLLLLMFLFAQFLGLLIVSQYSIKDLPYNIELPEVEKSTSFIPTFIAVIIATLLALMLIKFKVLWLWKLWFFLSVIFTLSIAFSAFIMETLAVILAVILALFKIIKKNVIIHNLTEMFIYGGLAAVFFQLFNILSVSVLLILISIYDWYAVRKSKHMVKMAKFQSKEKLFAGLMIPYKKQLAILGGGDIAFPLIFSAVLFQDFGFKTLIVTLFATLSLAYLFYKSEKKKFYPAMPVITLGCFIGYGFLLLI